MTAVPARDRFDSAAEEATKLALRKGQEQEDDERRSRARHVYGD
jgi:hypothetical protein